jgi:hypothetical protein
MASPLDFTGFAGMIGEKERVERMVPSDASPLVYSPKDEKPTAL